MPDLRPGADVNLLFGILALQLDFINREQLIAAMSAWAFDKSRSLSAILLEQGLLDAERHALLQALVEQRLKMHADNPHRSIAALNNVGELRQELDRLGASATQGTFTHVSSTPGKNETPAAAGDDPYATRSGRTQAATGERFRIVRPHARGGLGEVFVALDQELNREVALKEIQERHADNPDSRARFLLEAEVTGGLEHPGIVPVYALGKYEDGRPYYAMRFIRGDSLKDAIDRFHDKQTAPRDPHERALALRNLLRRFVDVCQAIQYAHDRGILHRDLKPSNIMVGRYGETLVVDWGLAKAVDAPEPATASISGCAGCESPWG